MATTTFASVIHGLYDKALDEIGFKGQAPGCTALAATLAISIAGQSRSPLHPLGEEAATAGLVARMAANFTFCAMALKEDAVPALWGHYSKAGEGATSEPATGADFALVVPVGATMCRVAVVQAKRADGGSASLYRAGTDRHPEEQMAKLLALGRQWMKELGMPATSAGDWIHYLLWTTAIPRSLTLTQALSDNTGKGRNVPVGGSSPFATLALSACDPVAPGQAANAIRNGWLELDIEDATSRLPQLLPIVDVVLADQAGGGAGLAAALERHSQTTTLEIAGAGPAGIELERGSSPKP